MVRIVDPNDEAPVWCRMCSGFAGCRLGSKLMNRCRPEKIDTKEAEEERERVSREAKQEWKREKWREKGKGLR